MIHRRDFISRKASNTSALIRCLLSGFLLFSYAAVAQQPDDENALLAAVEYAINTLPASQLGLYNGPDYVPNTLTAAGHPYFSSGELLPGTIIYDGIRYVDIYMLFDASRQLVVIEDHAGNKICPLQEKVEKFTVDDHTFKRLSGIEGLQTGFYDELVETKLFARRSKSGGGMQWKSSTTYYLLNESHVFSLGNKKTVFKSMADRENDVREYIRENKLSFGKNKETSLIKVVQYYSSLKHH